jgi:pyruvate,water dikinase
MMFCAPLDAGGDALEAVEEKGGKARSLRRLAAAGLPVPRAFVVTARLFQVMRARGPALPATLVEPSSVTAALDAAAALAAAPWPAGFAAELAAAIEWLGGEGAAEGGGGGRVGSPSRSAEGRGVRFAVRSSAALEDRADALGAGIFLSRTDVAARDVPAAVREVLASGLAPAALAYAARRGLPPEALAMAVLVHPYTPGDAAGTAAFDPAAAPEPAIEPTAGRPSEAARTRIAAAARALAIEGPVELEWVATGDDVLFLQLRPHVAPARRPWHPDELTGGDWSWDAAHNPLPLSPAQAGLVALVDERCRVAFRQRVVGGYLFFAPVAVAAPPRADAAEALRSVARTAEQRLSAQGPEPTLEEALELFVEIYEPLYGTVQPAARAARDALAAFLRRHGHADRLGGLLRGVPSLATQRARRAAAIAATEDPTERAAAVAAYLALFGDEAPVWDVATPTYAEDPGALARLAPAASLPAPAEPVPLDVPAAAREEASALLAAARDAAAVAEDDDVLYARLQARVRHALLREGRRLQAANVLARPEDVFWLPLEDVRRHARHEAPLTLAAVTHAVAAAREQHAAALADPPPLAGALAADSRPGGVRGKPASGGRALGRVHVHTPGGAPVPAGAILVARTLLPTELPLVAPAAVVVETGGTLGHVAAQARERGLPAIVDAPGASTAFREGDQVLVDGDVGVAIRVAD